MSTEAPKTQTQTPQPERIWTVLLYMAGDNNLSEECVYSLIEAKNSIDETNIKLTVLAQFDPSGVTAQTKRYKLRSNRYTLNEDADETGWTARETDTGEPHNLLEFIRWGISTYPAQYVMVVLAGHGSGTDDDYLLRDENPPNALGILEMHEVFKQLTSDGHVIDILGFDTCLMNMAEVCFELSRTSITYLVGSEGFSPNTGWPYMEVFRVLDQKIKTDPDHADPKWLAEEAVTLYKQFYEPYINGGISVDQSVLEVSKIEEVKEKFFLLVRSLIKEAETYQLEYESVKNNALILAHWETQSYNGEVFVDLYDFCERLAKRYPNSHNDVDERCLDVQTAIKNLVVKTCTAGDAFQFSFGASIYFPWAVLAPKYGNLAWPKETKWLDFLKAYHEKTRRPNRSGRKVAEDFPFRAAVPTTKGRNGRVESMRNPPIDEEWSECVVRDMVTRTNGRRTGMKRATKKKMYKSGKTRKRAAKKTAKTS